MDNKKRENLKKRGWKVGTVQNFLELSDNEMRYIEYRVALGKMLRERRKAMGYSQSVLAKEIGSSQSRVAKMEVGDNSVSIDLILKSLFHIGISNKEIGDCVASL